MFNGSIVALVTPFDENDRIDFGAVKSLIEWHIEAGSSGILIGGTTGESPTLSKDEFRELLAFAIKTVNGRTPIIAGTGSNNTKDAIEKTKLAKELGADASLSVTPAYNKPTQKGLIEHFSRIADEVDMPIILYNVPGRTGVSLTAQTVAELARHNRIIGIKEASADMGLAAEIKRLSPPEFILLSGDDVTAFPFFALGGRGVISVTANVAPGMINEQWQLFASGDLEGALKLHLKLLPLHRAMFWETNPAPAKAALSILGKIKNRLRLPLVPLSAEKIPDMEKLLNQYR
ncbi:MAG: 4-hydroxy-tetrahydrodipicolinate synthase [Myxococcota bacterium]